MKIKYSSTLLSAALGLALSGSANAAIVAGWHTWSDTTTPYTADILETGFTATAASGTDRINGGFGSNDGTFGSAISGASTSLGAFLPRAGGDNSVLTITLTNNSGTDYFIDSMHFDFEVRNNTGPDSFVVNYVSGGLGPDATEIGSVTGQTYNGYSSGGFDFTDHDYTLSNTLTDTVLGNGESATFTITFNQRGDNNNSAAFDNLAFQGTAVPEPSTALLGALGLLALLRRRR